MICRFKRSPQVVNHIGAKASEVGTGNTLGTGSRIAQPNRASHHCGAFKCVRQLPELIAVLSNHGCLDLVDQLPRIFRKLIRQNPYEARIAGELCHILEQDAVDAFPLRLRIRSGESTSVTCPGEDLTHPPQQRTRVDRLRKK